MLHGVPWRHLGTKKHTLNISEHLINCFNYLINEASKMLTLLKHILCITLSHSQQHIEFPLCHSVSSVAPPELRPLYPTRRGDMLLLLLPSPKLYQTFWTEEQLKCVKGESWKDLLACHDAQMKQLALWCRKNWSVSWYSELQKYLKGIFNTVTTVLSKRDSSNFISRQTLKRKIKISKVKRALRNGIYA